MKKSSGIVKVLSVFLSQLLILNQSWAAGPEAFSGRVVEVVDGTTIKVRSAQGDRLVRLAGLESESPNTEIGRQAKSVLQRELLGKNVTVENARANSAATDRITQNHDRIWTHGDSAGDSAAPLDGRVFLEGRDIALILVGAGLAWLLYNMLNDKNLQNSEDEAKKRQEGVWSAAPSKGRPVATFVRPGSFQEGVSSGEKAYGESMESGQAESSYSQKAEEGEEKSQETVTHKGKRKKAKDNPGLHKGWEKRHKD